MCLSWSSHFASERINSMKLFLFPFSSTSRWVCVYISGCSRSHLKQNDRNSVNILTYLIWSNWFSDWWASNERLDAHTPYVPKTRHHRYLLWATQRHPCLQSLFHEMSLQESRSLLKCLNNILNIIDFKISWKCIRSYGKPTCMG